MVECPVCGEAVPPEGTACEVCGLPAELFEPLKPVAAVPSGPPPDLHGGRMLPAEVEVKAPPPPAETPLTAVPSVQSSSPAAANPAPSAETQAERVAPQQEGGPTDEVLLVGRSLGLDLTPFEIELENSPSGGTSVEQSKAHRALTRAVVDGLLERYRQICQRRDALSSRSGTERVDVELIGYRKALREGHVVRADEHRQEAERGLETLEATWDRIHAEIAETNKMVRALRELGGIAPSVLRQITDSFRLPGRADPVPIEQQILRANSILWHLLVPRISHDLARSRAMLLRANVSPANADLIRSEIERLSEDIRTRNIGGALETSKWLRLELASVTRQAPGPRVRRSFIE